MTHIPLVPVPTAAAPADRRGSVRGRYRREAPTTIELAPVYVNGGLTLDFFETADPFSVYHFCFRASEKEFDAILGRLQAAGISYRSYARRLA